LVNGIPVLPKSASSLYRKKRVLSRDFSDFFQK